MSTIPLSPFPPADTHRPFNTLPFFDPAQHQLTMLCQPRSFGCPLFPTPLCHVRNSPVRTRSARALAIPVPRLGLYHPSFSKSLFEFSAADHAASHCSLWFFLLALGPLGRPCPGFTGPSASPLRIALERKTPLVPPPFLSCAVRVSPCHSRALRTWQIFIIPLLFLRYSCSSIKTAASAGRNRVIPPYLHFPCRWPGAVHPFSPCLVSRSAPRPLRRP